VVETVPEGSYPVTATEKEFMVTGDGETLTFTFKNVLYGKICGYKFFDLSIDGLFNGEETGIPNWEIELYIWDPTANAGEGDWIYKETTFTDVNGHYCFENLEIGLYKVVEVMQDGWANITALSQENIVIDGSGLTVEDVNFGNVICGPPGHTIGFWKNNIIKNLNGANGIQVPMEDLRRYLQNINDTYGADFDWLKFDVDEDGCVSDDEMWKAYLILSIPDASDMMLKAQAQMLSLLLTEQLYGEEYTNAWVYLPSIGGSTPMVGTMEEAITYIIWLYSEGYYEAAQGLSDYLNNLPESCVWMLYT